MGVTGLGAVPSFGPSAAAGSVGGTLAGKLFCSDKPASSATPPPYALNAQNGFGLAQTQISPLVLDLDGDGIELTALNEKPTRFDLDGDGFREATGWVKPDDGLLVLDRNNDGFINDISELFGTQTPGGSGFAKLR